MILVPLWFLLLVAPFVVMFGRPSAFRDICKLACAFVAPLAFLLFCFIVNNWVNATYYPEQAAADPLNSFADHHYTDPSQDAYKAAVEAYTPPGAPLHALKYGD